MSATTFTINALVLSGTRSQYAVQVDALGNASIQPIAGGPPIVGTGTNEIVFSDTAMYALNSADGRIALLYEAAFGRGPDGSGLTTWVNAYLSESASAQAAGVYTSLAGTAVDGLPNIAYGFTASAEFAAKYGSLDNTQYITQLYANVLHRAPDSGGMTNWMTALTPLGQTYTDSSGVSHAGLGESREYVLVGFAESSENVTDCAAGPTTTATGGWLINTDQGGYADTGAQLSASTVINQNTTYLDTGLINTSTITSVISNGDVSIKPDVRGGYDAGALVAGTTIVLSAGVVNADVGASNTTVIGGSGGGDQVFFVPSTVVNNAVVNITIADTNITFSGTGNSVLLPLAQNVLAGGSAINTTITGYVAGGADWLFLPAIDSLTSTTYVGTTHTTSILPVTILTPTSSAPVNGASLSFAQHNYILNVGNVGAGDAASVAAAANALYHVGDINGNASASVSAGTGAIAGENLTIIGETSSGNAVIYQWSSFGKSTLTGQAAPIQSADTNGNHLIDASELVSLFTLVGVHASSLTAADFH